MKPGLYKIGELTFEELNSLEGRKKLFTGAKPAGMIFTKGFLKCEEQWKSESETSILAESRVFVQDAAMADITGAGDMVTEINNVIQTTHQQDAMVMLIFNNGKENPKDWQSGKFSVYVELEAFPSPRPKGSKKTKKEAA